MTDTLLSLAPTYGPWLLVVSVFLSCLALPVPSSILLMTAGGFAATGDLVLWQVIAGAFTGFIAGDQAAYAMARRGSSRIDRLRTHRRIGPLIARASDLLTRRGTLAVFLSRTVFSPLGPYVSYSSGAVGLNWRLFSFAAVIGAACWAAFYALIGYSFAGQIAQIASLIGNATGIIMAAAVALGSAWWMWRSYRRHQQATADIC